MKSNKNIVRGLIIAVGVLCTIIVFLVVSTKQSNAERVMFTGNEQHVVRLDQAAQWTENFRKDADKNALVAGFFGRNIFEKILDQNQVVGIRIYNAKHDNGNPVFVLVGVDATGKDVASGIVGEGIVPCPPFCGWPPEALQKSSETKPLALTK